MFYFASLYQQQILGYGPLEAGFAFVPFAMGIIVGAGLAQPLIARLGVRGVSYVGIAMGVAGLLYFARLPVDGTYARDILPTIAITSIGMGLTFVPCTLLATTNVAAADAGLASGLLNTSQQVGGALGLAILSTLAASRTTSHLSGGAERATALVDGYHTAFAVGAGMLALAGIVLAATVRKQDVEAIDAGHVAPSPVA
jgi:hypothetical protein